MFDLIDHYNTGPKSELVYEIPMTTWCPYIHTISYQIKIDDLRKDDLVVCNGNAEVTSHHPYNVMVCCYIVLTENEKDVSGQLVSTSNGGNFTRNEHHRPLISNGSCVVDKDNYKYVCFVIYSASTLAKPEDFIRLENNYGRLYVLHYRKKEDDASQER